MDSDNSSSDQHRVFLAPFGEFLVWIAEDVKWLRYEHRILGRSSIVRESFQKKDYCLSKRFSLPVRLSFEEVVFMLSKSIVKGVTLSRKVSKLGCPSSQTIEHYERAMTKNVEEMFEISQKQKRLKQVGYYQTILDGQKIRAKRQAELIANMDKDHVASSSIRKRRRDRRMSNKVHKQNQAFENEAVVTDNDDSNSAVSLCPTLDALIQHIGDKNSSLQITEHVPHHLPRPTPKEWQRADEYELICPSNEVLAGGIEYVCRWLHDLKISHCKSNCVQLIELEIMRSRIYEDLWQKGFYVTTSTAKMGGDFLIYKGDPLLYHASHVVVIFQPNDLVSPKVLATKMRIANSLKKILLFAISNNNSTSDGTSMERISYISFTRSQ